MPSRHSVWEDSLFVPRARLLFGERAFRVAAPKALNQLLRSALGRQLTLMLSKKLNSFCSQILFLLICFLLLFVLISFCCIVVNLLKVAI